MKLNAKLISLKQLYRIGFLLILIGIVGCAASTQITGTWKSPDIANQTYNNVVVAAMTENVQARQTIENQLQAQLAARGVKATKSIDLFPPNLMRENNSPADMMLDRIKGDGFDGILTVAVVDQETETRYVPGTAGYAPVSRFGWYGSFRGYYNYWSPTLYQPGYYTQDKVYFLETNLYNSSNENLAWSAQSKTYEPATLSSFAEGFAEVTVKQMMKENIVR